MHRPLTGAFLALALSLAGCGKDDAAQAQEDGKATGAACRHAGYGLQQCFEKNPDALRSAMFVGWKEMSDYMRENKIAEISPPKQPKFSPQSEGHAEGEAATEGGSHAQAPSEGESHAQAPSKSESHAQAPSEGESHAQAPRASGAQSEANADRGSHPDAEAVDNTGADNAHEQATAPKAQARVKKKGKAAIAAISDQLAGEQAAASSALEEALSKQAQANSKH